MTKEHDVIIPQGNLQTLTDDIAKRLNVSVRDARQCLQAVLDSIRAELRFHRRLALKGFATFERRVRKGRSYKHPRTGKNISVGDRETVVFLPSVQLITDVCNPDSAQGRSDS